MHDILTGWLPGPPALAHVVPMVFAVGALTVSSADPTRRASPLSAVAALLAALALMADGVTRTDPIGAVMLLLIATLGVVIVRFSRRYLAGDPGHARFVRALLGTLTAVSTLALTRNLAVFAVAWTTASVCLHVLLTHDRSRPQALVAAHKKFLVSRAGDLFVLIALGLIGHTVGSLDVGTLNAWLDAHPGPLPAALSLAAVLLVAAAVLKSAQLPFHGWLLQVMEAPTPVSALLHAGVVNLGGFLMIRMAPLMARAPLAQAVLVLVGTTTAVLAALIAPTRPSVKVALAWSTCAQMGFMLLECGLGAWHLALLHLVGHSLYKAHAFLRAGSVVERHRALALAPVRPAASLARLALSAAVTVPAVLLATHAVDLTLTPARADGSARLALAVVLGLSLAPLLAEAAAPRALAVAALRAVGLTTLALVTELLFTNLLPPMPYAEEAPLRAAFVAAAFGLLFALQCLLLTRPRALRALHPSLFAGFYLDELFTRAAFAAWPPPAPPASVPTAPIHLNPTVEV